MQRELKPELLDSLPSDHPDALHNRRDLRLINRALGGHRWLARTLAQLLPPSKPVLEVGAGTGELGDLLAARGFATAGLDLWPKPAGWPSCRAWHRADLLTFDSYSSYPVIIGNLIFHQFTAGQLAALGEKLRRTTRVILACEPLRRRESQFLFAAIAPVFGANHVSLHDAHVSISAGFLGDELPQMLGLTQPDWDCRCHSTMLGTYRMVAQRI